MLLLFLIADAPFQLLLLSPIILWYSAAPHWHWAIAAGAVPIWGGVGWLIWRRMQRDDAEYRAEAKPQGDVRWRRRYSAERYCRHCQIFLHNAGWRCGETVQVGPDEVTFVVQKDRAHVLVQCRRGDAVAGPAEVAAILARRSQTPFTTACLVRERAAPAAVRAAAATQGVAIIRFQELAYLSEVSALARP